MSSPYLPGTGVFVLTHKELDGKMMETKTVLELFIEHEQEGSYLTLPFTMPPDTETFALNCRYERSREEQVRLDNGIYFTRQELNSLNLGLIAPDGIQVGISNYERPEINLSATSATPGYKPCALAPGEWQIAVGVGGVAAEGFTATFELSFIKKHRQLLKGVLHAHTLASDGWLTAEDLARHALRHGIDFLAITDHNVISNAANLPHISGITLIPGVEWTHFQGDASFLGSDRPFDVPIVGNTPDEALARFTIAKERGALIIINHPFTPGGGDFRFDIHALSFDCLEVWNGSMRNMNASAVELWQSMLVAGKKVPAVGGSDYHRDTPFQSLEGPITCVSAMSASASDILAALKSGNAYITYGPYGPTLELTAGDAIMGDTVAWPSINELKIVAGRLSGGDVIRVVTGSSSETILQVPAAGRCELTYTMQAPGFARIEIVRSFLPGLPMSAAMSNPIYFERE